MANSVGQSGSPASYAVEYSHAFNAFGVTWTPAAIPAGTSLTSVSLTVLAAATDNGFTDCDGISIANLPAGYSTNWQAAYGGTLSAPQVIDPGTGGRIVVVYTVK